MRLGFVGGYVDVVIRRPAARIEIQLDHVPLTSELVREGFDVLFAVKYSTPCCECVGVGREVEFRGMNCQAAWA